MKKEDEIKVALSIVFGFGALLSLILVSNWYVTAAMVLMQILTLVMAHGSNPLRFPEKEVKKNVVKS